MKKTRTLFNSAAALLFAISLAFSACDKTVDLKHKSVVIQKENMESSATSMIITGKYEFPSVLKAIDVFVDENESMDGARQFAAKVDEYNFTATIDGLIGTKKYYYYYRFYNGISEADSEIKSFMTEDYSVPEVTTKPITGITASSAVGGGEIVSTGELEIIAKGICWNKTGNPTIQDSHTSNGTGASAFVSTLSDLEINQHYFVRAYATNEKGTGYGQTVEFTTLDGAIEISLWYPESIGVHTIECGGSVKSDGGSPILQKGICWSTDANPDVNGPHTEEGPGLGNMMSTLTNLEASTTYYLYAYATNAKGTFYSTPIDVTTKSGITELTTKEPYNITTNSARSGGNILKDNGLNVVKRGVCWSSSPEPTVYNHTTEDGSGLGEYISKIEGLTAGRKYYVRAYAINKDGNAYYGEQQEFTTLDGVPNMGITKIEPQMTTANIRYGVWDDNGLAITEHGLCWSSTAAQPTLENCDGHKMGGEGTSTSSFSVVIDGLAQGQHYYIRVYAKNVNGTFYSSQEAAFSEFNTHSGEPVIMNLRMESITTVNAECYAYVGDDSGFITIEEKGLCWGTSHNPTMEGGGYASSGSGEGTVYAHMSGLSPETVYYVRVYVRYNRSVFYSDEISFWTPCTGGIPGLFSVSQSQKVCFSKGNLQYNQQKWVLAQNQWGIIGDVQANTSSSSVARDLFGWGTSNYHHRAQCYQPWSVNQDNLKYWAYDNVDANLYNGDGKAEWGYNSISGGGNIENSGWRTLKKDEWVYLISGRANANHKVSQGTVANTHGLILLPDDWTLPNGLTFTPYAGNWTTNTYTEGQWAKMELAGAVFLPAAGCRKGVSLEKIGTQGYYWTSSRKDDQNAYVMTFYSNGVEADYSSGRGTGRSVRLVKNQ